MPVLRFDRTTRDWVIFAPSRVRRPHEFRKDGAPAVAESGEPPCPFCPGHESLTPPEIFAVRSNGRPNEPGWTVRVIPNKFPALRIEETPQRIEDEPGFQHLGGCGAHEVIIESPDHVALAEQPIDQIESVLRTLKLRFDDLMRDSRFLTIVIFENHGERAGTSLRHPHFQLIATPVVPRLLRTRHAIATDYFDLTGKSLYGEMLELELDAEKRILAANDRFVAFLPYASHVPFETWILPREAQPSFGRTRPESFRPLAELLATVLNKLRVGLDDPDFNLTINSSARGDEDAPYFVWHVAILPRFATPAGFELGSGMSINTVMPEEAAEFLREVEP
jgi:UDPglucose--hexose-1-phosphate uridylyltransferase